MRRSAVPIAVAAVIAMVVTSACDPRGIPSRDSLPTTRAAAAQAAAKASPKPSARPTPTSTPTRSATAITPPTTSVSPSTYQTAAAAPTTDPSTIPRTSPSTAPTTTVARTGAGLLWTGDAETGDLSQFQDGPWNDVGGTKPKVVTGPVRHGKYAIQLGITGATDSADGICCGSRDELLPKFRDLHEGDDLWFGFSTYLAPGFVLNPDWQLITQFKQNFDGAPPLGLYVEDNQYKVEGGYGHPTGPRPFAVPIGSVTTGTWVDWTWHVKFSANPTVGFVEVWQNGRLAVPRFFPGSGTLYPGTGDRAGSYVKTGPYRAPSVTKPWTMYLDDWRIGTSQSAVARS